MKYVFALIMCLHFLSAAGQQADIDSLKNEVIKLRTDVTSIELNLSTSKNKFKRGIIVATLGYSITIAGGLMLGRKYDDVGKALLVVGGVTGITGTFMMVDAFQYLSPRKKRH